MPWIATAVVAARGLEIRSDAVSCCSAIRVAQTNHRGVSVSAGGLLDDIHTAPTFENLHSYQSFL